MNTPVKTPPKPRLSPDPILAELWEHKRQINKEANYDVATLAREARKQAAKILARPKKKS
jgi:hypothetical protein